MENALCSEERKRQMLEMLQHPFFQNALVAGILAALMCAIGGVYVLLKRIVFVGITLSQMSSAGVALALLLRLPPLAVALSVTLIGVACFSQVPAQRRLPLEGIIGVSYILAATLGVIFLAKNPVGEARALHILFGNILSVHTDELLALAIAFVILAGVHLLFYKEFLFVSFDMETARAQGLNARLWNLLLYLTLGLAIAFATRSMGVLLVFAFLIVPPMTARLLAHRMRALFTLSAVFGGLSVPLGLYLAFRFDLPTGSAVAATSVAMLLLVLVGRGMRRLGWRWQGAISGALLAFMLCLPETALAQGTKPPQRLEDVERDIQRLKESIRNLQDTVRSQADLLRQQEELLRQQEQQLEELRQAQQPPPAPPPPAPAAPAPVASKPSAAAITLPGGLVLNPEMRVEGNFIYDKTYGLQRDTEREGFPSNRFSIKSVEVGFRASVDPFATFEAIIEGQRVVDVEITDGPDVDGVESGVELEEAVLTLPRLPFRLHAKVGLMRTSFGEFNDDDPEEFPEIDSPNVVVELFGDGGEGWKDVGFNLNYQFGNPWSEKMTHVLWFGLYGGENDTAFSGGEANKPVYFTRFETFYEFTPRAGAELGISFAAGKRNAFRPDAGNGNAENSNSQVTLPGRLDTLLVNAHIQASWRPLLLTEERAFGFVGELFYSKAERLVQSPVRSFGGYALTQYQFSRRWTIGARFDAAMCPGFDNSLCTRIVSNTPVEDRFEWAVSPILTLMPSRFLRFRLQYKHTDRNYAEDSDEILLQALFIIGFERPQPF
jgi:ABC-type Mn2+/Zn2+ transport system permease subunit